MRAGAARVGGRGAVTDRAVAGGTDGGAAAGALPGAGVRRRTTGAPPTARPASATPTAKPAPNAVTCKAETATGPPSWIGANIVVATTDKGWAACTTSGKAAAADDPALAQLGGVPVPGNG